jgi:cytochrome d ubiquinol oxidase subunit I
VYGVMRTADAVSPVTAQQVGVSLLVFVIVYTLVFGTGIYYLLKLLKHGPALPGTTTRAPDMDDAGHTARRPLSAVTQSIEGA